MTTLDDDSVAIMKAKKLLNDPDLPGQLAIIKGHFECLVASIAASEERPPLTDILGILEKV